VAFYYLQGDYERLNSWERLTEAKAATIAGELRKHPGILESLHAAVQDKFLNRTVKNTALILRHFLPRWRQPPNDTEQLLKMLLKTGDLYRGHKMYIVDVLLDANYRRHVSSFRKDFLERLRELEDRPARRKLNRRETKSPTFLSLFDLKNVRNIGGDIPQSLVCHLCDLYVSGQISTDLRRCLSFELMRLHVADERVIRTLVSSLLEETDQTNACYVTGYLKDTAPQYYPTVYTRDLLRVVEDSAQKWHGNVFLEQSVREIHNLIK
jgi:hypothetical protein